MWAILPEWLNKHTPITHVGGSSPDHDPNCDLMAGQDGEDEFCSCQYYLCSGCNIIFTFSCGDNTSCTCYDESITWNKQKYCNFHGINTNKNQKGCGFNRCEAVCMAFLKE